MKFENFSIYRPRNPCQNPENSEKLSQRPDNPRDPADPTRIFRPTPATSGQSAATDRFGGTSSSSLSPSPPTNQAGRRRSNKGRLCETRPDRRRRFRPPPADPQLVFCSSHLQQPIHGGGSSRQLPYTADSTVEVLGHHRLSSKIPANLAVVSLRGKF